MFLFDPRLLRWEEIANITSKASVQKHSVHLVECNSEAYVICARTVLQFSFSLNVWKKVATLPKFLKHCDNFCSYDNYIYMCGSQSFSFGRIGLLDKSVEKLEDMPYKCEHSLHMIASYYENMLIIVPQPTATQKTSCPVMKYNIQNGEWEVPFGQKSLRCMMPRAYERVVQHDEDFYYVAGCSGQDWHKRRSVRKTNAENIMDEEGITHKCKVPSNTHSQCYAMCSPTSST